MTSLSRRSFVTCLSALGAAPLLPKRSHADGTQAVLRATTSTAQLTPEGFPRTDVWAYAQKGAGSVPGPEIRVKAGERVTRRLLNELPQSTAVHWHGIRIDNAMDGAAPLTQDPVPTGGTFDYDFVCPDPGTYWYHSHNRSREQVARGLAGPLIVEDVEPWLGLPGAATRELTLVLDDWLLNEDGSIVEGRWDELHAAAHAGRMGNTGTVNGQSFPGFSLRPAERVRLRMINVATDRIMPISLPGLSSTLVALDGHPVAPRKLEVLELAPAQRADIVVDAPVTSTEMTNLVLGTGRGNQVEFASFNIEGEPVQRSGEDVRPLPSWKTLPKLDLATAQNQPLLMEGGAMRGMVEATYQGEKMDFRELTSRGMAWAFNGVAHGMGEPMFEARLGRTVRMELANRSAFPHGIHVHGHHFTLLSRNSVPDPHKDVRDTVLIQADETVEIAFVADNPGKWMIHCHMLSHQASGMMGWFKVN
ncbi:multicopper oxidase family protein [Ruegeria profundi]|uniref:multicopper oxidase family protein n=1 Tax=Ruegeria profundi TaxID=1685378 RepID=UPI001CD1C478|nr:multicopper oxidase family protein [Ruegeria profundi]MCA0930701.1 multicopper oxidase family protein [Ruegeria profundi]